MKLLQIFNAVAFALMSTFAVTLGVVALMYAVHHDASPRMQAEWPSVASVTAGFWVLAVVTGLTWWLHRRSSGARWVAQAVSVALLLVGAFLLMRFLRG